MNEQEETTYGDDDVEGHKISQRGADAQAAEGDDDVEGHVYIEEPHAPNESRF